MRLKIIQFNYGYGGGSASACIFGERPASALVDQPYLAVHIGYTVHSTAPDYDPETQEAVAIPTGGAPLFIRVGFLWTQPVFDPAREQAWPAPAEYRNQIARMLANMVATAELQNLDARVPTILPA